MAHVPVNCAAIATFKIETSRHLVRQGINSLPTAHADVFGRMKSSGAIFGLAFESPVGMFHSAANYTLFDEAGRGGRSTASIFMKISTEFIMSFAISSVTLPVGMNLFSTCSILLRHAC